MFFGKTTFISIWRRYFTALANDTVWGEGGGYVASGTFVSVARCHSRECPPLFLAVTGFCSAVRYFRYLYEMGWVATLQRKLSPKVFCQ